MKFMQVNIFDFVVRIEKTVFFQKYSAPKDTVVIYHIKSCPDNLAIIEYI